MLIQSICWLIKEFFIIAASLSVEGLQHECKKNFNFLLTFTVLRAYCIMYFRPAKGGPTVKEDVFDIKFDRTEKSVG